MLTLLYTILNQIETFVNPAHIGTDFAAAFSALKQELEKVLGIAPKVLKPVTPPAPVVSPAPVAPTAQPPLSAGASVTANLSAVGINTKVSAS